MLAICRTSVEQSSLHRARSRLLPSLDDCRPTTLRSDVMPEEGWLDIRVLSLRLDQATAIGLQSVVHGNRLILAAVSLSFCPSGPRELTLMAR
jgi:hypothetical protein